MRMKPIMYQREWGTTYIMQTLHSTKTDWRKGCIWELTPIVHVVSVDLHIGIASIIKLKKHMLHHNYRISKFSTPKFLLIPTLKEAEGCITELVTGAIIIRFDFSPEAMPSLLLAPSHVHRLSIGKRLECLNFFIPDYKTRAARVIHK